MADYIQRGFYGASEVADAAKEIMATNPSVLGMLPAAGEPARRVDVTGTEAMFAIVTLDTAEIAVPEGMREALPVIVGALAGSTF